MTLACLTFHAFDQPFFEMFPFRAHGFFFLGSPTFMPTQVLLAFMTTLMLLFLRISICTLALLNLLFI